MDLRQFPKDIKIVPIATYANANSDRNSEVIDTLGFERCCIVVHFGGIVTNFVGQLYLAHSDTVTDENTLASGANVSTSAVAIADTNDNEVMYIDFGPSKRYYQLTVDKDATNACAESAIAYLYGAKVTPITTGAGNTVVGAGTDIVTGETIVLAASGTI
jgi:hypothetical protein